MCFDNEKFSTVICSICDIEDSVDSINGYAICSKSCADKAEIQSTFISFEDWILREYGISMVEQMVPMKDEDDYKEEWILYLEAGI